MKSLQAEGSVNRRSVCPVGAVSKMTWSNAAVASAAERFGEFVKGGDLDRAGTGELFLHALDGGRRQDAAIGRHHALIW